MATVVGAASALVLSGPPALARPLERGVDIVDETFDDSCGEFDVRTHDTGTISWRLRQHTDGDPYWSGHGDVHSTYTNLSSGRSWTGLHTSVGSFAVGNFFERAVRFTTG